MLSHVRTAYLRHCCNFYFCVSIPDLLASLGEATKPDGTVEQIGPILVKWVST